MSVNNTHKIIFWTVILGLVLLATSQILTTAPSRTAGHLRLNELVASNGAGLADEDGDYPDWIEIYNPGPQAINMSGWSLTKDPTRPEKWAFPNVTLGNGEYLVVYASGKNRAGPELHTNFKLSQGGDFVGLYNILEGRFIDQISPGYPPQLRDVAYGRTGAELAFGYLDSPSPGEPNPAMPAWTDLVAPVEFNPPRGYYDQPVMVELTTPTTDTIIRYTTDGSEPTETNGETYFGPLPINGTTMLRAAAFKPDFLPSAVATHSYIFIDQVINQPGDPPGWPAAWGTYQEYYPNLPPKGAPVVADYQMDPRIVDDPNFHDLLKEGLKSIPTLSIVTKKGNFDIYANAVERGPAWERPVSVEFFDPNDDRRQFQINAGLRMQGVTARWDYMPKKSFRLFFKSIYGANKLRFPLFPDSSVDEFDTLVLRGGANRSYAGYIDAVDYTQVTYTRDEWMRRSQIAMSGVGSHGIFVHLYLNGLYWGLYNVVERPDHSFMAAHYGGDKEEWFAVKHGGVILNPEEVAQGEEPIVKYGEEINGSNERYEILHELAARGNLADPENYKAIQSYLDTAQFSDYVILNLYAGNRDWNDNNWYAGVRNPTGRLRYFIWDGELVWDDGASLYLGKTGSHHKIRPLFLALLENPDFRIEFADRMYKNLFNDGPLTDKNSQARWIEINRQIETAIIGESARWGDVRYTDNPIDRDDWLRANQKVLEQMAGNSAKMIGLARQAGYYPEIDPPAFNQQGGLIAPGFTLTMIQPPIDKQTSKPSIQPIIYYTTDGSDPRMAVTGQVAPTAAEYRGPLVLTGTIRIKARSRLNDVWSALNEATFRAFAGNARLQITEIMYNPGDSDEYEFIELKNSGDTELNLANMFFEGINFTFAPGTPPLAPGEFVVLVRNATAFSERYPGVTVGGVYGGQLSNQGEEIRLKDAAGETVISVAYDDGNGWPITADGRGDSLVLIDPTADPYNPKNWRASVQVNGSPGADDYILQPLINR